MTNKEIVRRYLELSEEEISTLKKELHKDKIDERNSVIYRYSNIMYEMTGVDPLCRKTDRSHVDARAVLSYVMRNKGYNDSELGRIFKKDRTAIGKYVADISFYIEHNLVNSRIKLLNEFRNFLESVEQ